MKYFAVIVLFAVVAGIHAITDEQKRKAEEHAKTCIKETGVAPEAVQKLRSGDFSDNSDKIKKFSKCFFEKIGFLNANGDFLDKVAIERLSEGEADKSKVEQLVNACKAKQGSNKDDGPLNLYKCYIEAKAL